MRVPLIGNDPRLERPKSSTSKSFRRTDTARQCVLSGTKREQIVSSEVPGEMLEELEVVFFVVFDPF